jgi:hypothetical protein
VQTQPRLTQLFGLGIILVLGTTLMSLSLVWEMIPGVFIDTRQRRPYRLSLQHSVKIVVRAHARDLPLEAVYSFCTESEVA